MELYKHVRPPCSPRLLTALSRMDVTFAIGALTGIRALIKKTTLTRERLSERGRLLEGGR